MLELIQTVETTLFQLKVLHSFYQDVSEKEKYSGVISRWPVIHRKMLPVIAEFHSKFVTEIGGFQVFCISFYDFLGNAKAKAVNYSICSTCS